MATEVSLARWRCTAFGLTFAYTACGAEAHVSEKQKGFGFLAVVRQE